MGDGSVPPYAKAAKDISGAEMHQHQPVDVLESISTRGDSTSDECSDEGEKEDGVCILSAADFVFDVIIREPAGQPGAVDTKADT